MIFVLLFSFQCLPVNDLNGLNYSEKVGNVLCYTEFKRHYATSKTYANLTNINHKNNQQITQTSSQCDKTKFLFTHLI